jgi:predicted phosphoribosyltransferase
MSFVDRSEAGKKLALALEGYRDDDVVVLALPRGGVPVAVEVAKHLGAPMDLLLVRKIGVPSQPELAMGAVVNGAEPTIVRNDEVIRLAWVSAAEFDAACHRELAEIERRRGRYLGGRLPEEVSGRVAIIIDDGIATGATIRAAIRALRRRKPRKIVLAVPVAPPEQIAQLRAEADDVICLETPSFFHAIGLWYGDFRQLTDEDVIGLMQSAREAVTEKASKGARKRG